MKQDDQSPVRVAYERRNQDLDPQLVWRGTDEQDWSDLVVHAPPLYIQEKVHPKVLIDDLLKQSAAEKVETDKSAGKKHQLDLFGDFNGIPKGADKTDFYQYDQNWSNRMILGDSLQVMARFAEREGLRGKVQCIYFDPPYGIKFNSNFQWSTTSRDVKDGNVGHHSRAKLSSRRLCKSRRAVIEPGCARFILSVTAASEFLQLSPRTGLAIRGRGCSRCLLERHRHSEVALMSVRNRYNRSCIPRRTSVCVVTWL